MTIPEAQTNVREILNTERQNSLAFVLKAASTDHGGVIEVATKILRGEIEKAVRNAESVYGVALRDHRRIVVLTTDGKICRFGVEGATWGEVAKSAISGLSQIASWARWRQSNLDILNTQDAAAREILRGCPASDAPDMKATWFLRSVARVFDVPADLRMAQEARKPVPVATLEDLDDATIQLAAGNVDVAAELEEHYMAAPCVEAPPKVEQPEEVEEEVAVLAGYSSPSLKTGLAATEVLNTLRRAGYWSPDASPDQNRRKLEALMASHERMEARVRGPVRRRI